MICLEVSKDLLAIGFSSGTILVLSLDLSMIEEDETFHTLHKFSVHKSGVTTLYFSNQNTQLLSGGQDTSIVVYDLVQDTALYKLLGHKEQISGIGVFHKSEGKVEQQRRDAVTRLRAPRDARQ